MCVGGGGRIARLRQLATHRHPHARTVKGQHGNIREIFRAPTPTEHNQGVSDLAAMSHHSRLRHACVGGQVCVHSRQTAHTLPFSHTP